MLECDMLQNELDNYKWIKTKIPFPFKIGEICLHRYFFHGIWCTIDIFSGVKSLSSIHPPIKSMMKEGVQLARLESYPVCKDIHRVFIKNKYLCFVDSLYNHYYVETDGGYKNYLESKKKIFSTIKRKIKKIEISNRDSCYFEKYESPDEILIFFDIAISISKKTFQHLLLGKGLPDTETFKKNVKERSEQGSVIGYILKINDKPVAYNFCPIYNGSRVLYDYSGYDPEYKEYSPGTVLQFKIIEDLFKREKIKYYDLCTGEGWHKEMFATGSIVCGNFYFCFIWSRYSFFMILKIIIIFTVFFLKNILQLLNLKDSSKRFLRDIFMKLKS